MKFTAFHRELKHKNKHQAFFAILRTDTIPEKEFTSLTL